METAYILLGKTGDILSGLRVVQSQPGKKPVVISRQYASVLDGIPDIEPVVYDGEWDDLKGATKFAKQKYRRVINLQTYGKDILIQNRTPSFQLDQVLRGGVIDQHNDLALSLNGHEVSKTGEILVADHSESSPFPHRDELWKLVNDRFGKTHKIVRLDQKLPNFKDFLNQYNAAALLVTIETAHLHLSAATKTPVIALTVDEPSKWRGSAWHPRFHFQCRYSEFLDRKGEFVHSMETALAGTGKVCVSPIKTGHYFSYNPSIIQHRGQILTCYRFHKDQNRWRTELAIDGQAIEMPVEIAHQSIEDPRLFEFGGDLWVSFTVSKFDAPAPPIPCIVAYGKLVPGPGKWTLTNYTAPKYGKNDWSGQEKNFVFFEK